jgi:hypothetical protein
MPPARLIVWDDAACWRVYEAGATTLKERVVARTQELREEPRAYFLEQTIRDRLQAVVAEAGGSTR